MILDAIIKLLMALVKGMLALFPAYTPPDSVANLSAATGSWLGTVNRFFPLVTLGACIALVLAVQLYIFVVKVVILAWDLFPFKAS